MQRLLAAAAMDRHGAPGVIDEQLLAGEVTLAHRALQALFPTTVDCAEGAALIRRLTVTLSVLFSQQ